MDVINEEENLGRMLGGELYYAFAPNLIAMRERCKTACRNFNRYGGGSRREKVRLWRDVINDQSIMPITNATGKEELALFKDDPIIEGSINVDYGFNLRLGKGVYINFNCTFLDTCLISIGSRTLIGPNCSFFTATHPLDPFLRNGVEGPELGAPITIGEDCWFGGNLTVCPGVTIGRGVSVGAGSVVTKDVPPFHLVAGNPAKILKKIETTTTSV
ncbi:putative acetyltransferase [Golovinomyces cichoracearum]|uniref:Putative acetyltransferase n=1 Tax=Golovinomyces cichoracearum TaxID=62708 RepID=A0A420I0E4_9PEZI|nr:putative acetyltransferase [Golovinomyces cichoracearum]